MNKNSNGTPTTKKQVFFSIGSYGERDKPVINKISTNGLFSKRNEQSTEPIPKQFVRPLGQIPSASIDETDSVKNSLQIQQKLRKFKPFESLVNEEDDQRLVIDEENDDLEKPTCPPTSSGTNDACKQIIQTTNRSVSKPNHPPKTVKRSVSLEPQQFRNSGGKVALTIASYEGEPRTPTRLDFLPSSQGRLSRSSSKESDASSSLTTTPLEEETNEAIGFRLQNELVATLRRSNLKKRHDEHRTDTPPPSPASPATPAVTKQVDFELHCHGADEEVHNVRVLEHNKEVSSGIVKQVATVLEKNLTFRTNSITPETKNAETEVQISVLEEPSRDEKIPSEKESKPLQRSIDKAFLANAYDEIITLTDDTEKKS